MMHLIKTLLALVAVLNLSFLPSLAQTAKFTPGNVPGSGGIVTGKVPINKVGGLMGTDLQAYLSDGSIEVVEEKDGQKQMRLAGVPVLGSFEKKGDRVLWTGTCYWRSGPDRGKLAGKNVSDKEILVLKDGKNLVGDIENVSRDWIDISTKNGTEKVSTQDVSNIKSPYATIFKCVVDSPTQLSSLNEVFEGPVTINFTKTYNRSAIKLTKSQSPKSTNGMSKRKKIALGVTAVLLIATAIAVPLAVAIPVANSNRSRRHANQAQENLFLQNFLQQQQMPNQNQNQNQNQN